MVKVQIPIQIAKPGAPLRCTVSSADRSIFFHFTMGTNPELDAIIIEELEDSGGPAVFFKATVDDHSVTLGEAVRYKEAPF